MVNAPPSRGSQSAGFLIFFKPSPLFGGIQHSFSQSVAYPHPSCDRIQEGFTEAQFLKLLHLQRVGIDFLPGTQDPLVIKIFDIPAQSRLDRHLVFK